MKPCNEEMLSRVWKDVVLGCGWELQHEGHCSFVDGVAPHTKLVSNLNLVNLKQALQHSGPRRDFVNHLSVDHP